MGFVGTFEQSLKSEDLHTLQVINFHSRNGAVYIQKYMFVQGLDHSIASRIESVFAKFPWVLIGHVQK